METDEHQLKSAYVYKTLNFAIAVSIVGSILLLPTKYEPSLGFTVWLLVLMAGNLYTLKTVFKKLNFNILTVSLLITYCFVALSFVLNTKSHFLNAFLAIVLLPLITMNLVSDDF